MKLLGARWSESQKRELKEELVFGVPRIPAEPESQKRELKVSPRKTGGSDGYFMCESQKRELKVPQRAGHTRQVPRISKERIER